MLTDKEKLEEELKLLEESLHLEVITKEEYEQARQRIERKLKSLEKKAEKLETKAEKKTEEVKIKEVKREETREVPKAEEENAEEEIPSEEKEEDISEEEPEEERSEEDTLKSAEEIAAEQVKKAAEEAEIKEEAEDEEFVPIAKPEERKEEDVFELSKGSIKVLIYAIAILVLAFGSYFFFFSENPDDNTLSDSTVFIACSSDQDCKKEGSIGTCNNPRTKDAECAYVEDVEVKLAVLNGNDCFNCDTGRVLSILNGFFPNLEIENLDIKTNEGKEIAAEFNVDVLPAYILNSSLQQASNYHKFFNAFNKVGDSFVMKDTVSNANYYINREEIPGKLDLIVKPNQAASADAERNLQEFLDAFGSKVDFEKHSDNSALAKELGINTFPVFLVNNKVKFSGVQAADVIKDNFCRMNDLEECGLELSKSLV